MLTKFKSGVQLSTIRLNLTKKRYIMKNQTTFRSVYLLSMALITLNLNNGCEKEERWVDAIVLDFGSPAVDGCGFVLEIGGNIYFPINLEEKYLVDKKEIRLQYSVLEDMQACGFPHSGVEYQEIRQAPLLSNSSGLITFLSIIFFNCDNVHPMISKIM